MRDDRDQNSVASQRTSFNVFVHAWIWYPPSFKLDPTTSISHRSSLICLFRVRKPPHTNIVYTNPLWLWIPLSCDIGIRQTAEVPRLGIAICKEKKTGVEGAEYAHVASQQWCNSDLLGFLYNSKKLYISSVLFCKGSTLCEVHRDYLFWDLALCE